MFSNNLQEKLNTFSSLINLTISLDRWTDNSENSIYSKFLKNKVKKVLSLNGIQTSSTIAVVTDNVSNMNKMQQLLNYSLAKVCMDVSNYKQEFWHCLSLSETMHSKYFYIESAVIKSIICDRYHFATNDILTKVIRLIVNAIKRLESNDSILADIFKELINIYQKISQLEVPLDGFQVHMLAVINKYAREFDNNIYFITFFLSLAYKQMAISKKMDADKVIYASFKLAKSSKTLQTFWTDFIRNAFQLCCFAMKVFSIVPYRAGCERLFSSLALTKSKKQSEAIFESLVNDNRDSDIFFDEENEQPEELNEKLEEIIIDQHELFFLEELFNFLILGQDQE
ncbi:2916_t:CDS:2, partial [Cetraspora pellucida]